MEGIISTVCEAVSSSGKTKLFSEQFSALTTNKERVKFFLSLEESSLLAHALNVPALVKDAAQSQVLRTEGNRCYARGEDKQALRLYTEAVCAAPSCPGPSSDGWNNQLSLAYANRSAALLRLGHAVCSLVDVERALLTGCPSKTRSKLSRRLSEIEDAVDKKHVQLPSDWQSRFRSCCSLCLEPSTNVHGINGGHSGDQPSECQSEPDEIAKSLRSVAIAGQDDDVDESFSSTKSTFHRQIPGLQSHNEAEKTADQLIYIAGEFAAKPCPRLDVCNSRLPSASDKIQLAFNENRTRHIVATEDIEPGEVLVVEPSYSTVILPDATAGSVGARCHYCCRWSPAPFPCHSCSQVLYCSEECGHSAWHRYHRLECPVWNTLVSLKLDQMALLAFRTLCVSRLEQTEESADETEPVESPIDTLDESNRGELERLRRLESHHCQRSAGDLFRRTIIATVLGRILTPLFLTSTNSNAKDQTENRHKFGELAMLVDISSELLLLLQTLPCNAHQVCEQQLPALPSSTDTTPVECPMNEAALVQAGSSAYPTLSLFNHSCWPNVFRVNYGSTAVLYSLGQIRSGQELLDNYGQHYAVTLSKERQNALWRQYYFNCTCKACVEGTPLYANLPAGHARCRSCNRSILGTTNDTIEASRSRYCKTAEGGSSDCCTCDETHLLAENCQQMADCVQQVMQGRLHNARNILTQCLANVEGRVNLPWQPINDAQEALKLCCLINGNKSPLP